MIICIKWIVDVTMVILTRSKLILSKAVDESIMLRYIHLQEALETIRSKSVQWIYCQSEKSYQYVTASYFQLLFEENAEGRSK